MPPGMSDKAYARKSLDLTLRWLDRGWKHFNETEPLYGHSQSFFPIVQGCTYPDLRRESPCAWPNSVPTATPSAAWP